MRERASEDAPPLRRYPSTVQHRRFYVTTLSVDGEALPSHGGDLVVARRVENPAIDWELVHQTSEDVTLELAPCAVQIGSPEGDFSGSAILVRSDGRSHVFRGAGDLVGFNGFEPANE